MRITVLGLGRMGRIFAVNLVELGHDVTVYDRAPERLQALAESGARVADSLTDAVKDASVALTMVADDAAEEALTLGLLTHLPAGAIHLCMSTIGVAASRKLAAAHDKVGQGYVAAPVLGRPSVARARQLWILAGGPDPQVNRCLGVLEALGRGITRVGPDPVLAHALRLGISLFTVTLVQGLSEALHFGEQAGYSAADYLRVLNMGLIKSPLLDAFGGMMVREDFKPSDMTLDQAAKDVRLALEACRELGLALPLTGTLEGILTKAQAQGQGNMDLAILAQVLRAGQGTQEVPSAAGEEVEAKGEAEIEVEVEEWEAVTWEEVPPMPEVETIPEFPAIPDTIDRIGAPLSLERVSHFEEDHGTVWAWSEGTRLEAPFKDLAAVEQSLPDTTLVRVSRHILVKPGFVQAFRPRFAGRAQVELAGGLVLNLGRDATRRLKHELGF